MKKIETLKKNRDFSRVYTKGKSYVTPVLVVYVQRRRQKEVRVGITTSKKIGNAVERNRARRVIRESVREVVTQIKPGYDIVLVARKKTVEVKSGVVLKALSKVLSENKLFAENAKKAEKKPS